MGEIKTSKVYDWLASSKKPIKILQGGSGSSKTYSILQILLMRCFEDVVSDKGDILQKFTGHDTIDIIRRTLPALKMSAMTDFEKILKDMGRFETTEHNISQNTYKINGNKFQFYSTDNEKKMRGPRRDYAYFNEVLEMKRIDVLQVLMRTNKEVYGDYNPSEEIHWLYDEILPRDDVDFLISTHKDNPFLSERSRAEIERLKEIDPNLYRVYGEGLRGVSQASIFYSIDYFKKGWDVFEGEELFGLDFGYNDETAFVRIKYHPRGILIDELLYKTNLTSQMIIKEMNNLKAQGKINENSTIFADSARPEIIEEIYKEGYNIRPVKKGAGSVLRSINFAKRHKLYFTDTSVNAYREFRGYKWKVDKNEKLLDEPVDINNHCIDATFYACSEKSRERREIGAA